MSKWESISLGKSEEIPTLPGCINWDITNNQFVSITFKTEQGLVRVRKSDYSTVTIEKQVVETKPEWKVTWKMGDQTHDKIFQDEDSADALCAGLGSSFCVEKTSLHTPIQTDDLLF